MGFYEGFKMRAKSMRKTHGAHGYQGKTCSRGTRQISKLLKGLTTDFAEVRKIFEKIEKERGDRECI